MASGFRTASYTVSADSDPGVLIRLLDLFALRDIVPSRVRCRAIDDRLAVEIEAAGIDEQEAELIAGKMRAMVAVSCVRLEQMALRQAA